jgi:hypothetical protein
MKRPLLLAVLLLLALTAPWRPALRGAAVSNPGQVTSTFNYTVTQSSSANQGAMGTASGNLSLTMTETCTYKVLEYTDQGITLDDGQCTTNVSGGGNAKTSVATYDCKQVGDRNVKCAPITKQESYTCMARPPNGRMTRLSLDPVTGTGGISFTTPSAISKSDSGETSSEGACAVYPGSFFDTGDTRETIVAKMDKYTKDLAAAQRFKFNPNDSSFSGGNSFSRSWSSGGRPKSAN